MRTAKPHVTKSSPSRKTAAKHRQPEASVLVSWERQFDEKVSRLLERQDRFLRSLGDPSDHRA